MVRKKARKMNLGQFLSCPNEATANVPSLPNTQSDQQSATISSPEATVKDSQDQLVANLGHSSIQQTAGSSSATVGTASARQSPRRYAPSSRSTVLNNVHKPSSQRQTRIYNLELPPTPGRICYLPHRNLVPANSAIHQQKKITGFFGHPVLIVEVEGDTAYFYASTSEPPISIRDHSMFFWIGRAPEEEDETTLRLAPGSLPMWDRTAVNLEQRFEIEWRNLHHWKGNTIIDPSGLPRLERRIVELEAMQNRYLYKPLVRDMGQFDVGTIVMLLNPLGHSTIGAPVVIMASKPNTIEYLRIKETAKLTRKGGYLMNNCIVIKEQLEEAAAFDRFMFLRHGCPALRVESYVELGRKVFTAKWDQTRTWCYPAQQFTKSSMDLLGRKIRALQVRAQLSVGVDNDSVKQSTMGVSVPSELQGCGEVRLDSGLLQNIEALSVHPHSPAVQPRSSTVTVPAQAVLANGYVGYVPNDLYASYPQYNRLHMQHLHGHPNQPYRPSHGQYPSQNQSRLQFRYLMQPPQCGLHYQPSQYPTQSLYGREQPRGESQPPHEYNLSDADLPPALRSLQQQADSWNSMWPGARHDPGSSQNQQSYQGGQSADSSRSALPEDHPYGPRSQRRPGQPPQHPDA